MKFDPRSPGWFGWLVALPSLLFGAVLWLRYHQLERFLSPKQEAAWSRLLPLWAVSALVVAGIFLWAREQERKLSLLDSLSALAIWILQGAGILFLGNVLESGSIPAWIQADGDLLRWFLTATLPGAFWCMHVIACVRREAAAEFAAPPSLAAELAALIGLPVAVYVFFVLILPMLGHFGDLTGILWGGVIGAAVSLVFLFFFVRLVHRMVVRSAQWGHVGQFLLRLMVFGLLPGVGLYLSEQLDGIFGNFQAWPWKGLLALGALAHLVRGTRWRLVWPWLVFLRALTFPYYAYFTVVMMPFLPLAVILVAALGSGILLLAAPLAFVMSWYTLRRDARLLGRVGPWPQTGVVVVGAGLLVIPAVVLGTLLHDRSQFREVLEFAWKSPGQDLGEGLDPGSIQRAFFILESRRLRRGFWNSDDRIPYLSGLYDAVVFDNLELAPNRKRGLARLFARTGEGSSEPDPRFFDAAGYLVPHPATRSADSGRTWVDFRPQALPGSTNPNWEFRRRFEVPDDVFVDAYSLDVNGDARKGLLVGRRAARWIYESVVAARRDPGWLRYQSDGGGLLLSVFPFQAGQSRLTSIRFVHQGRAVVRWSEDSVVLDGPPASVREFPSLGMVVPAKVVDSLPRIRPRYHLAFVLDASEAAVSDRRELAVRLNRALAALPRADAAVEIYAMGATGRRLDRKTWMRQYIEGQFGGGFNLERAAKRILLDQWKSNPLEAVGVVAITNQGEFCPMEGDLFRFLAISPAFPDLWILERDGQWGSWPLGTDRSLPQRQENAPAPALVGRILDSRNRAHLVGLGRGAQMVPFTPDPGVTPPQPRDPWGRAAALALRELRLDLSGDRPEDDWKTLFTSALESGVLTRGSSYLALETDQQQQQVMERQRDLLQGDQRLDLEESPQRMSEPGWWVLVPVLMAGAWWSRRRREALGEAT